MTGLPTIAERSYRLDVRQLRRMMFAGIFDDQKVELVRGRIYLLADRPPQIFAVARLRNALLAMFADVE
jgi:hypothetical protein